MPIRTESETVRGRRNCVAQPPSPPASRVGAARGRLDFVVTRWGVGNGMWDGRPLRSGGAGVAGFLLLPAGAIRQEVPRVKDLSAVSGETGAIAGYARRRPLTIRPTNQTPPHHRASDPGTLLPSPLPRGIRSAGPSLRAQSSGVRFRESPVLVAGEVPGEPVGVEAEAHLDGVLPHEGGSGLRFS